MIAGDPKWLHVEVDGAVSESPGSDGLLVDPKRLPPLSSELATAIRDAATDEQVKGIWLDIQGGGLGWAQIQSLRDALVAFQAGGKPCVAWAPALSNNEYYLASAAPEAGSPRWPPAVASRIHLEQKVVSGRGHGPGQRLRIRQGLDIGDRRRR